MYDFVELLKMGYKTFIYLISLFHMPFSDACHCLGYHITVAILGKKYEAFCRELVGSLRFDNIK